MSLRRMTFRPAGGIRMDLLVMTRGSWSPRALLGGLTLIAVGLWSSLGADPWTSLSGALSYSAPSNGPGWRDVGCADGMASILLPAIPPESEEFTELLLVTAFGGPDERTTVELRWESGAAAPLNPETAVTWSPIPPPVPRRQALLGSSRGTLSRSVSANRSPARDEFRAVGRSHHLSDRIVDFPKSGMRGLRNEDFATTRCRVAWSGRRSRIWLPDDEPQDARLCHWVERLGELLEQHCLPTIEADQGPWPDVDGDSALNLLVTNRVAQTSPDVKAFVRQVDFQADVPAPWGQNWDVVYVQPGTNLDELRAILIHELTHVAQFSWCRQLLPEQPWPVPDWLTEGLAHAAELRSDGKWDNTLPRLRTFANRPASCPLLVSDAGHSGLWRDPGQRGASAAFCDWWTRRSPKWSWPEVITTYAEQDDPWGVLAGAAFSEAYRDWTISLAADGVPMNSGDGAVTIHCENLTAGKSATLVLTGTATAYVHLQRNAAETHTMIAEAGAEDRLQVTALRLPATTPR